MNELKPCPFCGGAARIESNRDWHRLFAAHADDCVFDADDHDLMYPAQPGYLIQIAEDWNRRAAPADVGEDGGREAAVQTVGESAGTRMDTGSQPLLMPGADFPKTADVGEDGPISDAEIAGIMGWRGPGTYTAASLRKIRCVVEQAIVAERNRNMARIQHLTHERDQARADCVRFEKAWHASFEQAMQNGQAFQELMAKNEDLRAQLAARGQEPVAWACAVNERHEPLAQPDVMWGAENPWEEAYQPFPLYRATPHPAALQEKP